MGASLTVLVEKTTFFIFAAIGAVGEEVLAMLLAWLAEAEGGGCSDQLCTTTGTSEIDLCWKMSFAQHLLCGVIVRSKDR